MANTLTLLVRKAYAVPVASERSRLASCIQKENALSLLIRKADAVARVVQKADAVDHVVRTTFALTLCVCKLYAASRRQMP